MTRDSLEQKTLNSLDKADRFATPLTSDKEAKLKQIVPTAMDHSQIEPNKNEDLSSLPEEEQVQLK